MLLTSKLIVVFTYTSTSLFLYILYLFSVLVHLLSIESCFNSFFSCSILQSLYYSRFSSILLTISILVNGKTLFNLLFNKSRKNIDTLIHIITFKKSPKQHFTTDDITIYFISSSIKIFFNCD